MRSSTRLKALYLYPIMALLLAPAGAAFGAEAVRATADTNDLLSDVVVTATRQVDTVNRVPLSISAVTQASLTAQGIQTITQLAAFVPGLQVQNQVSGVANFTIRGIGANTGAAILLALCWGQPNRVAVDTYLLLWVMRSSTKLNLFLGVRNLYTEFLPSHLRFLASYFRQRPMNLLFPVSVSLATVASVLFVQSVFAASSSHQAAAAVLLATLCILGLLEHWFLVLPLPIEQLWRWGLASHRRAALPQPVTPVPGVQEAT